MIADAVQRAKNTIFSHGYVPWRFHPRNADFEPDENDDDDCIDKITLQLTANDPANLLKPADGEIDESYSLSVSSECEATVMAQTSLGLVRGLTTFSQLFYKHSEGGAYTPYAPVDVADAPVFAHRGLNMDLSRAYFPVTDIQKTIDALSFNKFNRLHLHITDAQSWPLEITTMPELTEKGAYRSDMIYTKSDLQTIQYYGALQGVEVYLEIDMPGHTSSVWYSHPELIASFNIQPDWNTFAAEPPSGTMKLNEPKVPQFIKKMTDDLFPRVSKYTAYFHTGGDEVNKNAYLNDDTVRSNDSSVLQPLMQKFVDYNHKLVRDAGMTPIVWEEMLLFWNLTIGKDVIVQTWQSDEAVAQTVAKGHKALAGNYNFWYLDCGQGQWLNFVNESSKTFFPYADYCSPRKNWRLMYSYDPYSGVSAEDRHLVIGGEVHAWAEQIDPVNLDRVVWPRAAAAGEILWSGAKDSTGGNRSQADAAMRLSDMRERLVAKGIMAEPIQMAFCTMEEGQCNL